MSIRVKCACGAHLLAPPDSLGKTISCSQCHTTLFVPSGGLSVAKVQARDELQAWLCTACPCGKLVPEPATWAGMTTRCPWCSNELVMPNPKKTNPPGVHPADPYVEEESAAGSAQEAWSARSALLEELDVDAPLPDGAPPARTYNKFKSRTRDDDDEQGNAIRRRMPTPRPQATTPDGKVDPVHASAPRGVGIGTIPSDTEPSFAAHILSEKNDPPAAPSGDAPAGEPRAVPIGSIASDTEPSYSGQLLSDKDDPGADAMIAADHRIPSVELKPGQPPGAATPVPAPVAFDSPSGPSGSADEKSPRATRPVPRPWRWVRGLMVFWNRGFVSVLWRKPLTSLLLVLAVVVGLSWLVIRYGPAAPVLAQPTDPIRQAYFYDLETNAVFSHSTADLPFVMTPWQSGTTPRGARAYIFTCGQCVPAEWEVMYIENYSDSARTAWREYLEAPAGQKPALPQATQGRFLADPKLKNWVPLSEPGAADLLNRTNEKWCADGRRPRHCEP